MSRVHTPSPPAQPSSHHNSPLASTKRTRSSSEEETPSPQLPAKRPRRAASPHELPANRPRSRAATPINDGGATQWETVPDSKLTRDAVAPWLTRDLSRQTIWPFPRVLRYLLSQCLLNAPTNDTEQSVERALQSCLNAVVPIANSKDFKNDLRAFCTLKTKHERDRYKPFVTLTNSALTTLHAIRPLCKNGERLLRDPPPRELSIVALRHDPKEILVPYKYHTTRRSPDVVLAGASDVSPFYGKQQLETLLEGKSGSLAKPIPSSLPWTHIKTSSEFKRYEASISKKRPTTYNTTDEVREYDPFLGRLLKKTTLNPHIPESKQLPSEYVSQEHERMHERNEPIPLCPDAQLSMYAVERLGCLPAVTHHVGFLLGDDILWLFWHDRQGVIQSTGISVVLNAPHFLLVLLVVQRFNSVDWGVPEGFPEQRPTDDLVLLPGSSADDGIRVNWRDILHRSYGLTGRCARVFNGTRKTSGVVVKISHRDKSRLTEDDIVNRARGEAESMKFPLKNHLPVCLFSCDLRHDSAWIREFLNGSADGLSASRIPRITVWETLLPIHHLPAADFVRCWLEVIHAHRVLWERGIRQLDPTLSNTMVRTVEGKFRGVLNDWDLANVDGVSTHDGLERSGMRVFFALDLMNKEGFEGLVPRLYRHDLESFAWILIWVVLQYDNENNMHETPETSLWTSIKVEHARNAREHFLWRRRKEYSTQMKWEGQRVLLSNMRKFIYRIAMRRMVPDVVVEAEPEPSDERVYAMFWDAIDAYYQSLGPEGLTQLSSIQQYLCLTPPPSQT